MIRRFASQRGSQVVEFVLVAPILLVLILSAPILGMMVRAWVVVETAAREGARYYAMNWYNSGAVEGTKDRVERELIRYGALPATDESGARLFSRDRITVSKTSDCAAVTVEYLQPTFVPFLADLFGGKYIPLKGGACFLPERN